MSALNLAAAIAQAQQSVARHESQNAGDPFHFGLTEHRYVALRDLLAALSTPPADDVREALDHLDPTVPMTNTQHHVWERLVEFSRAYRAERGYPPNEAARTRFLFSTFEVRSRGTVTDAEVEAAADAICRAAEGEPLSDVRMGMREQYMREARAALKAAREVRS